MDAVLDVYPDCDVLPEHAVQDFVSASWQYAQCQKAVADHYGKRLGYMIFDITVKTHWTLHCAIEAAFLNPRFSWIFSGKDFMMNCSQLHATCCKAALQLGVSTSLHNIISFWGDFNL